MTEKPDFKNLKIVPYDIEDKYEEILLSHTERLDLYKTLETSNNDIYQKITQLAAQYKTTEDRIIGAAKRAWEIEGSGR